MKVLGGFRRRALTSCAREIRQSENRTGYVRVTASNGVMEEGSGKVQKASAHEASMIVVDVAIVESHVAAIDADSAPLQEHTGTVLGNFFHRPAGKRLRQAGRRGRRRTQLVASLS